MSLVTFTSKLKTISDQQQSWGHERGHRKEPGLPLLVAAD